jgi:Cu2+-exporting ATPase
MGSETYKKVKQKWFHPKKQQTSVEPIHLQKNELETTGNYPKMAEKKINQMIGIGLVSLIFATGGFFFPPLSVLCIPLIIYNFWPRFLKTWQLLKEGKVSVDILASLTGIGCIIFGYFFIVSVAALIFIISEKLLAKVTQDSKGKLIDIFTQTPDFVWILKNDVEVRIPFEEVKPDDIVVVNTGETIPADGVIVKGFASIDQHILTGEARPLEKETGELVFASTLVLSGRICVKVETAGSDTVVARIGEILNNTADFKSTIEMKSSLMAQKTVMPTLVCSAAAFPLIGSMGALAVINAHFKDKLSVVIPISILNFFRLATENGILIKDGRSLDLLDQVDTIVFDKTGTLTDEQPSVGSIHICSAYTEEEILLYAASAERHQTHPIARAILHEAKKYKQDIPEIDESDYKLGYGLTVSLNGKMVHVGSSRFMELSDIDLPLNIKKLHESCHINGLSLVMVAINHQLAGVIELIPTIRPEAKNIIHKLRKRKNIKYMYIISGDNEISTKKLAEDIGIRDYFAETLPEEKFKIIEQLKSDGKIICYIGDGINDSIALKSSHVSVSLGEASKVAKDTAQIILMNNGLSNLDVLFDISKEFTKNTNNSYRIMIAQTVIGISGVFLLGFGLGHTIALNLAALAAGTANSMLPLVDSKKNNKQITL